MVAYVYVCFFKEMMTKWFNYHIEKKKKIQVLFLLQTIRYAADWEQQMDVIPDKVDARLMVCD